MQRDCHPSALNTFLEALARCRPPVPIKPSILKYLGKSHNLWHRATLLLEQIAFENHPMGAIPPTSKARREGGLFQGSSDSASTPGSPSGGQIVPKQVWSPTHFFLFPFCKKKISSKNFSLPFIPATPLSPSWTLEGLFELTLRGPRRAWFVAEKQGKKLRLASCKVQRVPGQHQQQLTQTLIVRC